MSDRNDISRCTNDIYRCTNDIYRVQMISPGVQTISTTYKWNFIEERVFCRLEEMLGPVDIWRHVILSDHRERRISLKPLLATAPWRFFVAALLRMTCFLKCQQALCLFQDKLEKKCEWLIVNC
jgi:hypothetical protein